MGRQFDDDQVLHSAIDQYQFLRKEYPGSKYRFDALFTVGEIYKDDLNDPAKAKLTFEEFLHRYPRNRLADDAKQALNEIAQEAAQRDAAARKGRTKSVKTAASTAPAANVAAVVKDRGPAKSSTKEMVAKDPAVGKDSPADSQNSDSPANATANDDSQPAAQQVADAARGRLPRVTSIRHWSTPDYTRVAIDVEQEILSFLFRLAKKPARRAVVVPEYFGPFEKIVLGNHFFKFITRHEEVFETILLISARFARGVGD